MARPTGSDSIISTCSRATTPARATPWRCTSWPRRSRSACTTPRRERRTAPPGAARGGERRRTVHSADRVRGPRAPCPRPTSPRAPILRSDRGAGVRTTARGRSAATRLIDLSYTAAAKLDMIREGTTLVEVRALTPGAPDELTRSAQSPPPSLYVQAGAIAGAPHAPPPLDRESGVEGERGEFGGCRII